MERISNVLPRIINQARKGACPEPLETQRIDLESLWVKIAGEKIGRHTQLTNYKNGAITIRVDNAVYLNYLNLERENISREFRKHLGDKIKKVIFKS